MNIPAQIDSLELHPIIWEKGWEIPLRIGAVFRGIRFDAIQETRDGEAYQFTVISEGISIYGFTFYVRSGEAVMDAYRRKVEQAAQKDES